MMHKICFKRLEPTLCGYRLSPTLSMQQNISRTAMRMLEPLPPVYFEYRKHYNMPPTSQNSAYIGDILPAPSAPTIQACESTGYSSYSDYSPFSEQSHVPRDETLKCPNCEKYFSKKSTLTAHMKVHEPRLYEERPHACGYQDCSSRFERQADLHRHQNSVSLISSRRYCTSTDVIIETQPGVFVSMPAL